MATPKTSQELVNHLQTLRQEITWSLDKLTDHNELWSGTDMTADMPTWIGAALHMNGMSAGASESAAENLQTCGRRIRDNLARALTLLQTARSGAQAYEETLLESVRAAKASKPEAAFRV